ncbi:DUF3667 domain-containing protein [Parvularcula oceani]|uniref:DUF3667 domain-containing protein n=1 Tax=Parvularcula oceani TaxID=1247963 RepID=UPI0004E1B114|nr:DUF3667 domain-containing protein [Parvularcula oceani]
MSETDILQAAAVTDEARAGRKARMPLPERCYACHAPVLGPYCHVCGQKNDDCRRSLIRLAAETLHDVMSLDGRFAHTVRAVVTRPGRYVREYGGGRRSPYSPPIRFFLVVTFLFFTTLWVTDRQIVVLQPDVEVNEDGTLRFGAMTAGFFQHARDLRYSEEERALMRQAVTEGRASPEQVIESIQADAQAEIDALRDEAQEAAEDALRDEGRDAQLRAEEIRAEARLAIADIEAEAARRVAESAREEEARQNPGMASAPPSPPAPQEEEAAAGAEEDGAAQDDGSDGQITLNGELVDTDRLLDAAFRLAENPRAFNNALDDWIPRIMILMIPLMALLGAFVIHGRDALLYDHALLSLNTHAVAFGILTLGLWTSAILPGWLFAGALFLGVPIYYGVALKGAYGRSLRKVIFTTLFVFTIYGAVLSSALGVAAVSAFADTI